MNLLVFVRNRAWVSMLLLSLVALVIMIAGWVGPTAQDDFGYAYEAARIAAGYYQMRATSMIEVRIFYTLPTALVVRAFGTNTVSAMIPNVLAALLTLWLVYLLGLRLFNDERTGFIAAALMMTVPRFLPDAVRPYPTVMNTLFWTFSVYSFLRAEGVEENHSGTFYFLAGFAIGAAVYQREYSFLLLLFFLGYVVLFARRWKTGYLLFVMGGAVAAVLAQSYYYLASGDFLFIQHRTLQHFGHEIAFSPTDRGPSARPYPGFTPGVFTRIGTFGLLSFASAIGGVVLFFRERTRALGTLTWWIVSILIGFDLILANLIGVHRQMVDYLIPLFVPLALLAARSVVHVGGWLAPVVVKRRRALQVAILILSVTSILGLGAALIFGQSLRTGLATLIQAKDPKMYFGSPGQVALALYPLVLLGWAGFIALLFAFYGLLRIPDLRLRTLLPFMLAALLVLPTLPLIAFKVQDFRRVPEAHRQVAHYLTQQRVEQVYYQHIDDAVNVDFFLGYSGVSAFWQEGNSADAPKRISRNGAVSYLSLPQDLQSLKDAYVLVNPGWRQWEARVPPHWETVVQTDLLVLYHVP